MPGGDLMGPGVGIDVLDADGFTPLHGAAFEGGHLAAEWLLAQGANPRLRSTAAYAFTDPILAAEWTSTITYPAGLRAYDLARIRHNEGKWSTSKFRRVGELLGKATPRQSLLSR